MADSGWQMADSGWQITNACANGGAEGPGACGAGEPGYAGVYDAISGSPGAFLRSQVRFLDERLAARGRDVLDAGCGTGQHVLALSRLGYRVVGLDLSAHMLAVARAKLSRAGQPGLLVRGALQALPFRAAFDTALCLESPLAFLLTDEALGRALTGMRRALRPRGLIVIDVFDYRGTLGEAGTRPQARRFRTSWGRVDVREAHRYDPKAGLWTMRQEFNVLAGGRRGRFAVEHCLRIRAADSYAAALERAGFQVLELLPAYPGMPPALRHEQRMIFVAQAG